MLIIYHDGNKVVGISNGKTTNLILKDTLTIAEYLVAIARDYPNEVIIWCHFQLKSQLNIVEIAGLFHHQKLLYSFNPSINNYLDRRIGYVEASPFIKINKQVAFTSWQMSSWVGGIYSEVVLACKDQIPLDKDFDYFLSSLAKLGMPNGLLCYSEPRLLKQNVIESSVKSSMYILFRFVKQHYKTRWLFILLFNLLVYERKFPILPFLIALFYKNRNKTNINLDYINVSSSTRNLNKKTVDVIIPTIGRQQYVYDVLKDLKVQTHLPLNVIIVEQNPDAGSKSQLEFLTTEDWPFVIKHSFTHQAGACNARNIALKQISSEWVFFADDDIRIEPDFIQKALEKVTNFGIKAASFRCFQKGQKPVFTTGFQWGTFGSGCSFVYSESLNNCYFKLGYEFGFGEDGDFGMQLRNQGVDVLYLPEPSILHLKAPIGGFRTKPKLQWQNDEIQPKPSPTIMLYQMLHNTEEQIRGYKSILFLKYYKLQTIRNPFTYYTLFQKQWNSSVFWAKQLKRQNEV